MKTIFKSDIVDAIKSADLQRGDSVMVHTSLGKIGYVCGGARSHGKTLILKMVFMGMLMKLTGIESGRIGLRIIRQLLPLIQWELLQKCSDPGLER